MSWPRLEPGRFISLRSGKDQVDTVRFHVIRTHIENVNILVCAHSTIDTSTGIVSETRQGVHE
jgi:hypothetical protein